MNNIIGYAALQIIPTMKGTSNNLAGEIGGPLIVAGRQAGAQAGQAVATGLASAQAAVAAASAKLAKSRDAEADAAGKIRVAEAKLQEVRAKGQQDTSAGIRAAEALATARRKEAQLTQQTEQAVKDLAQAEERAATATDDVADSASNAGGMFKNMFSGLDSGTKKLAALTAGAAGFAGVSATLGKTIEKEMDVSKMNAAFGASGELAAEYGRAASAAYAGGVGESMSEVTSAVGMVQSSFATLGFEGDASIEQATTRALNFANVFDTDVASSVQAASTLVTNGLARDSTEAFDLMTKSFQSVPAAMRDELPEIIQEYGTNFRALGFDGQESFNILVGAAGQGKFALDKTGDALKEFTILATDGSKSSTEAFQSIGLNAEEMGSAILGGGDEAQAALQRTASEILAIEDPLQRAQTAIALFGTPLEDLSVDQIPGFLSSIAGAPDAMGDFAGATDRMGETLNDNIGSKLETLKRGFESTFTDLLGDNVLPILGDFTGALEDNEGSMLGAIAGMTGMGGAVAGFESAKGTFDSVKEGVMGVKDSLVSAKDTVTGAWEKFGDAKSFVSAKATAVGSFISTSASATVEAGKTTAAWVSSHTKSAAGWVAVKAQAVGAFVASSASAVVEAVKTSTAWVVSNGKSAASFLITKGAMVATTIATGAMTGAQWLLNAALNANPIGIIIIALVALVGAVVLAYQNSETFRNIVQAAWEGIQVAIDFAWNNVIRPVFDGFMIAVRGLGDIASWLWNEAIMPAFNGIGSLISLWWDGVTLIFDLFMAGVRGAGDVASWLYNEAIRPAFDGIRSVIDGVMGFLEPLWERFKNGLSGIGDMASSVGSGMRSAFDGVVGVIKAPIRAIGQLLASIPDKLFGFEIPGASAIKNWGNTLQNLREGGAVAGRKESGLLYGPGSGTSDSIWGIDQGGMPVARVSRGEWVTPENAVNAKTVPLLEALRRGWTPPANFLSMATGATSLALQGDYTSSLRTAFGIEEDDPRVGAILDFRKGIQSLPGFAGGGFVAANQLVDFARGVEGKEYDWGGVNWGDCSGAVSALANYATGRDAFGSRFATGTEDSELAARGFLPGLGPMGSLNVGWFNGGPYGGHTAATLPDGTNFEMGGARGNGQFGGGAAGANDPSFTDHAHLPPDFFLGGDLGSPTFGDVETSFGDSSGSGGGGAFAGGGAGVTSGGGSGGGTYSGSGNVSSTGASAVFVTNWPSNGGGSFAASSPGITQTDDASANYGASEDPEDPYKKWQDEQTTGWRDWSKDALKEVFGDVLGPIGLGGQAGVHIENMYAMDERKAAEELERAQKNRTDTYGGRFR